METATILAEIGASKAVVAAGLLHDTIDDSSIEHSHLEEHFGSEVADLVKGVSKEELIYIVMKKFGGLIFLARPHAKV